MLTTDQTLQALTDAFNAAGIDSPQKVQAFVSIAALQVRLNSQNFELQKLAQKQASLMGEAQAEREAKQAEINETQATLLALVAAQSGGE
jgi:hypothetical protein